MIRIHILPKPLGNQMPAERIDVRPTQIAVKFRPLRVLDFDIENRPLSYLGSDFTTAEVTAISWAWLDRPDDVTVYLLGETELREILAAFCEVYARADIVTGHYITGHDLPMINGALMECLQPALSDKMVHDTKVHLIRSKGISCSQESLGAMLRLDHAKVQMNQGKWRAANRLTPEGLALVRERVVGDVKQHIAMRRELMQLGYLGSPKLWRSGTAKIEAYTP
jgi:hypothetical protein